MNQMFNILLGQLQRQNPQGYNQFMKFYNSGKSPDEVLNQLLESGIITQQQVNQANQQVNQYSNIQNTNRRRF